MSEYDLKKSEKGIGQLYPILEAKDGSVIDGFHREGANKNWKRVRLEHIDTPEKKAIVRITGNKRAKTNDEHKQLMQKNINILGEIYKNQGCQIPQLTGQRNEVVEKIVNVTGLAESTVRVYLKDEFKVQKAYKKGTKPRVPASQAIISQVGGDYGKRLVERHREEVLAEEKPRIEQQVKAKLLKSPDFQREVVREIQKPRIVTPSEPCPSGVCELPPVMEAGKPIDVRAEALTEFWKNNPHCLCKKCPHYGKCGVIR